MVNNKVMYHLCTTIQTNHSKGSTGVTMTPISNISKTICQPTPREDAYQ